METLLSLDGLISLLTLTLLEIVLGIDNIIFISIFAGKLPQEQQPKARAFGLGIALVMRIAMLLGITWIIGMKEPLLTLFDIELSIKDIILLGGGLFLLAKTTSEMHASLEGGEGHHESGKAMKGITQVVIQIALIDLVFSFDSILTAVGLVREVLIMIGAVVISMVVMLFFSKAVSEFVNKRPTIKMLALSFLLMIGFMLILESLHVHVPKGYIYFAMVYALFVEVLNMRVRKKKDPIKLHRSEIVENDENLH